MRKILFILGFCCTFLVCCHVEPSKEDISDLFGPPTYERVYKVCKFMDVKYPEIVLAQSVLETGHYTSKQCKKYNNLFGLYDSKRKKYYEYDHWIQSVSAYKRKVQYKYKGGDYYQFLKRIGYAEDINYINKVKSIEKRLSL